MPALRLGATRLACLVLLASSVAGPAGAATVPPQPDAVGTLHVPAMDVPFSIFASPDLRRAYVDMLERRLRQASAPRPGVAQIRVATTAYFTPLIKQAQALYPVTIQASRIAGVAVDVITPSAGVSPRNRNRVLINLHGGGFFTGAGAGGQIESIPIAGLGRIRVVSVDYRQGPEHRFPAASEDAAAVFRGLLKRYRAHNIGIYGGSAGGFLTAETVAWLQVHGGLRPGAVALISASAGGWAGGDSTYFAPLSVVAAAEAAAPSFAVSDAAYFNGADLNDPLVAPIRSPALMAQFPPTLVITGSRDVSMSAAIHTHVELVKLGVDADLHVWEGAGHAFLNDPSLPESKEAYAVIVRFFDRRLGR